MTAGILTVLAILLLICLVLMYRDNRRFVVREYCIYTDKIEADMTYVFLSDLHEKDYGEHNASLLRAVDRICPDGILVGGDMIVSARATCHHDRWFQNTEALISSLEKEYPVFAAEGNHETRLHSVEELEPLFLRYREMLQKHHVRLLENEQEERGGVRIYGFNLPDQFYRKFHREKLTAEQIREELGVPDPDKFNIVLLHHPGYFPVCAEWGADLVLSGHLHGGMVRLPGIGGIVSPEPCLFPKYSGGEYTYQGSRMVLSCGLGGHTLPIRLFNPGELTVLHLKRKNL